MLFLFVQLHLLFIVNMVFGAVLEKNNIKLINVTADNGRPLSRDNARVYDSGIKPKKKRGEMPGVRKMMYYTDSSRMGIHFAKDPHVIAFQNRYLMY